ncbi:ATPase domain-containing protein [Methanothermobacter sp. K4]|uniref:ATPase domain-containing protein n=1 Tax=Methanothermobacter sp. K4 TaxID=2913262 RepID=UPI00351D00AE
MRFRSIEKSPTGIKGLDMVTGGGFPEGRNTLIYGGPGTGKTFIAVEFLLNGAFYYGEPGVLVSFDEPADNIVENFQSDERLLEKLMKDGKIFIEDVSGALDPSIGSYSLDALKIRIEDAVKTIGARRVVLDKVDSLFDGASDMGPIHMELRHLISWLKGMGVTSVFTAGDSGANRPMDSRITSLTVSYTSPTPSMGRLEQGT